VTDIETNYSIKLSVITMILLVTTVVTR